MMNISNILKHKVFIHVISPVSNLSGLRYCSTMSESSGNQTCLDRWEVCLDKEYLVPGLYHAAENLCFLLGLPALVWFLWLSLSGSFSGGVKPTQVFPINLFAVELVFCFQGLLEVISSLLSQNIMLRQINLYPVLPGLDLQAPASELHLCGVLPGGGPTCGFPQVQTPEVQGGVFNCGLGAVARFCIFSHRFSCL